MDISIANNQLKAQGEAILQLAEGLTLEQARWKPDEKSWSVLEVMNHLVDEEVLDFRRHLDHLLHTPDAPWPKIDPQGWVTAKRYNERQLDATLAAFTAEREASLKWLDTLQNPNWDSAAVMPWGGLSAGDMLASWLAHDLLHLRQLIELRYTLMEESCLPYSVEYAGGW
ncbi:DinB family protein [Chloroflexota bacterium]|nr:DinB family protein [Chloroflexota bacterium]